MQIRALMYFDELVRTGSMRQAAENLGVAATAVSRQIENLEHFFGAPLVDRSPRGVRLTSAGELLADRAGRTLREIEHVHRLIDDLKGLQQGKVAIQAGGAVAASLLAPALAEFSLRYPKLRFEVTIASTPAAVDALLDARADIAVTLFAGAMPGTRRRLRADLVYDAIMAPNHPAAGRPEITLAELARHPLVMPEPTFAARKAIDAAFARERLAPEPTFVTSSLEMQKEMVVRGAAITLLPALTVERESHAGLMVAVPIAEGKGIRAEVDLCVAQDRQLPAAAARLLDFIERFMRETLAPPKMPAKR